MVYSIIKLTKLINNVIVCLDIMISRRNNRKLFVSINIYVIMYSMFLHAKATALDVSSFDTSNITNTSYTFGSQYITSLKGIENFTTSNITDMSYMFYAIKVSSLDLSSFDTSKVTNMSYMFKSAGKLNTIYASDKFVIDNVTSSDNMFGDASSLVGGAGTQYNSSYVDKTYAIIDGGTSTPGYFTLKS